MVDETTETTYPRVFARKPHPHHPWVFSNEIHQKSGDPGPGDVVEVFDNRGRLGLGFYNPHSLIAARLFTRGGEAFDVPLVRRRLQAARALRERVLNEDTYRLVFGESDGLPGLVIDKFGDVFALQTLCYGMDARKEMIAQTLAEEFLPVAIVEKNTPQTRKLEGLEPVTGILHGSLPEEIKIEQDSLAFHVDVLEGQKTGFFLDQRDTRRWVKSVAKERNVLDMFCYTGAFSLYAAAGGATSTLGIDASSEAVELAQTNASANQCSDRCSFVAGDAFDFLRESVASGARYDLVILDPPSFSKSKKETFKALRGYKEINLQAMKLLPPGGILVTCSCSYHISREAFMDVLVAAARNAGKSFRIIYQGGQALDHPLLLGMPESEYLKAVGLELVPRQ